MISALIPKNEQERLKELENYNILDSPEEKDYNEIVNLASAICGTPISLVSLVDNYRQWFKAKVGLGAEETPKEIAFCSHALLQDELFIVSDASKDERFFDNPLVTENPNIRFYAGMPLKSPNGYNLGTLCVIDTIPRDLTENQKNSLRVLSNQVINCFELRRKNSDLELTLEELKKNNEIKNKLFSIIGHDLKSPIANIDLFLQILEQDMLTIEDSKEHLNKLRLALKSTDELMSNLFNWAKSQLNNYQFEKEDVCVSEIINLEIKKNEGILKNKNINVVNLISDKLVINVEQNQFSFMIRNLFYNSIKFTDNANITFSSNQENGMVNISIKDEGIGMDEKTRKSLFSWKDIISKQGTKGESGTGFGLLIISDFVNNHNGNIFVDSELQKGTNVIISFPIV